MPSQKDYYNARKHVYDFLKSVKSPKDYEKDNRWNHLNAYSFQKVADDIDGGLLSETNVIYYLLKKHSPDLALDCLEKLKNRDHTPIYIQPEITDFDRLLGKVAAGLFSLCVSVVIYGETTQEQREIDAFNRFYQEIIEFNNQQKFDEKAEQNPQIDIFYINGDDMYYLSPQPMNQDIVIDTTRTTSPHIK